MRRAAAARRRLLFFQNVGGGNCPPCPPFIKVPGGSRFSQKPNENKSHTSKNEFIHSFFEEIDDPKNLFEIN